MDALRPAVPQTTSHAGLLLCLLRLIPRLSHRAGRPAHERTKTTIITMSKNEKMGVFPMGSGIFGLFKTRNVATCSPKACVPLPFKP